HLAAVSGAVGDAARPVPLLLCLPPDLDHETVDRLLAPALDLGVGGVVLTGGVQAENGGRLVGVPAREQSLQLVRFLRGRWGGLASLVAATRVVLPYDETFLGLARAQVAAANDRLLPFMTHDRFTLAGIMVSIGVLYAQLALFGMRRGAAWARRAVLTSAAVG